MSVRIIPARSGKGFEYDIRFTWPEGGRLRERGKSPVSGKDASKRWAEARERAIATAGKAAYKTLSGKHESKAELNVGAGAPTFEAFWPRVVSDHYQANRKKASTLDSAETIFKCHLRAPFGAKRLTEISTADVAALKGALRSHGPKTVNNVLSILSRALRCAVDWEVIPALPCRFGLLKVPDPEMDWYEMPVYRRLVDAAGKCGPDEHLLVLLAGSAGLRRGEIRALRWCDVDLERRQLQIAKALWRKIENMPKGNRGRVVPLTDELVAALKAQRTRTGLRERVLYSDRGEELSNRAIRNWMARAQKRAGVEANGGIHFLRHTFCSHLAIAGVPAKAIQELAGHADLKTTMRYLHLAPGHKRAAVSVLQQSYEDAEKTTQQVG